MGHHHRNLQQQLTYAVRTNFNEHVNKHSLQAQGIKDYAPKSYQTMRNTLGRAKQFARWCKTAHPEIRMARDLREHHYQEWLQDRCRSGEINTKTATTYQAQLRSVAECSNKAFNTELDPAKIQRCDVPPEMREKERCQVMNETDWARMRATVKTDSTLAKAMDISHASGIRADEIARLKGSNLNFKGDRCTVTVEQGKNGRMTHVEVIDRKDIARLQEIKEKAGEGYIFPNGRGTHLKADTLNKELRGAMKKTGLSEKYPKTSFHAERKAWAQRSYDTYRQEHTQAESKAWISQQLEHRDTRGEDSKLMEAYVNAW